MANSSSYMDGVSVKISEKYKPPRRINASMSYSQMLTLNKLIHEPAPSYDFTLEETVISKMKEWHRARCEDRRQRISKHTEPNGTSETTPNVSYYTDLQQNILTPTPMVTKPAFHVRRNSFNLSEFESDTSSPFDNMELKTINDLEELAQVLNHDRKSADQTVSKPPNGFYFRNNCSVQAAPAAYADSKSSVPEIMRSLEAQLGKETARLDDCLKCLSVGDRQVAVGISAMGFPIDRVVRACRTIGNNQKKVMEHLLALTDLLDLGFPEQSVVDALLKCNNDRDKALDLLIT